MRYYIFLFIVYLPLKASSQNSQGFQRLATLKQYILPHGKDTNLYSFGQVIKRDFSIDYLPSLARITNNKEKLLLGSSSMQYFQILGTSLSFIGDYYEAINQFDSCGYDKNKVKTSVPDKAKIKNLQLIGARKLILDSARYHNLVMINEAHHQPRNRILTYSLLKDLYNQGYRLFGLEALSNYEFDSKNPISSKTGYYTIEPVMADLLRYAKEIGFELFAYEAFNISDKENRDSVQARNIISKIEGFTRGKVLIHAGYGHIAEKNFGVPVMGEILKKLLNEDPLTIDQTEFSEGNRNSISQLMYNEIVKAGCRIEEPTVVFDGDMPLDLFKSGLYDLYVYSPPSILENGRPNWLAMDGFKKKRFFSINKKCSNTCYLVQSYFFNETESMPIDHCVPADQSYFFTRNNVALYLRSGTYLLVFRDGGYNILYTKKVVII